MDSVAFSSSNTSSNADKKLIQQPQSEKFSSTTVVENHLNNDSYNKKELSKDSESSGSQPLAIFGTTFVTIFLAEIGDKTQISTLMMSAQSHQPWVVFLGAGVALISTSLLGVALGSWVSSKLSPKTVEKAAGVTLLLVSLMLFGDVIFG
ncbi:MAG: TMEM165/GDT1 family protein [Cyanobacteria bacterium J06639_18]